MRVSIRGIGKAVPDRVVTNAEVAKRLGVEPEWIESRTGIRERRYVSDGESTATLGLAAARQALDRAGLTPASIGCVVVGTCSPEHQFPSTACVIAHELGMTAAPAFDVSAACSGFVYSLAVGAALTDGIGPGLRIDHNLFQGNTAESGSGGGLRLQGINGNDVLNNPTNPSQWYSVAVTNNIFANNVAGWAGGGVSIQDAVRVSFDGNTVASNDSTATAGVLFDTLGAPNSSVPPPGCNPAPAGQPGCTNPVTNASNQPAGFESHRHTLQLAAAMAAVTNCGGFDTAPATLACKTFSVPELSGDVFWYNRAFHITVGAPPMSVVQLTPALSQTTTGSCPSGATYWDIGVQGDTGPTNHASGLTLRPMASNVGTGGYPGASVNPSFTHMYCNGSRVPPEIAPMLCTSNANAPGCIQPGTVGVSMTTPVGIPDNNPFYVAFTLNPAATVDEGNNWINMFYGPLSTVSPVTARGATGYGAPLGNYSANAGPGGAEGATPW